MIRATPRAVLLFACGIPPALFAIVLDAGLWPFAVIYGVIVLAAIAADAGLSFPIGALRVMPAYRARVAEGVSPNTCR